jgi:hypothetical protein
VKWVGFRVPGDATMIRSLMPMIPADCLHQIRPLPACSIPADISIALSAARAEYFPIGSPPFPMRPYPMPDRQTGHFICPILGTDHLLAAIIKK